jgi:hypothetical protein
VGRFLTKQERTLLEKELWLERYARFSDGIKCILLLNRYYERFADFKGAILKFFANIKQYRLRAKVSHDP